MKLATLALIGVVGVAATGTGTANATPLAPDVVARAAPDIVQVRGGCGPGWRPTWRGCVPDRRWRSRNWRRRWW
jgi:hypothetical protein